MSLSTGRASDVMTSNEGAAAHGGELNSHVVYLIENNCDESFIFLMDG